jgi:hypothetical protein
MMTRFPTSLRLNLVPKIHNEGAGALQLVMEQGAEVMNPAVRFPIHEQNRRDNSNLSIPKFMFAEQNYKVKLPGLHCIMYHVTMTYHNSKIIYTWKLYTLQVDFKRKKKNI